MAPAKKAPSYPQWAGPSVTAKIANADVEPYAVRRQCASCGIQYTAMVSEDKGCPLCRSLLENRGLRLQLSNERKLVSHLENRVAELRARLDVETAIRAASETLNADDTAILVRMMTEHRDSPRLFAVRVTHGPPKDHLGHPTPNGFFVQHPDGELFAHTCTSVGGRAIAGYLDEALRSVGPSQAMTMLTRALNRLLLGEGNATAG